MTSALASLPPVPRGIIAVAAGWLLPGAGHLLLGRWKRALLFASLIFGCFGIGLAHDGRLALRDVDQPVLSTLQVVANAGIGPADLFARMAVYGEPAYSLERYSLQREHKARRELFRDRSHSRFSLFGTAYLWTAGLMNLLLLFEVWDLGLGRRR